MTKAPTITSLSPLLSPLFPFFFFILFKPMSRRFYISRFESLSFSLPSSLSPLLSPLFPFFFLILFANTTKTAPFLLDMKKSMVGLGISRTNADSQWIQFTTHFIEFFVLETKRFVGCFLKVILTRQTCGQRSSRAAESKRRTQGNYFSERICYIFLISKCR